jgi:hypothetical protein
MADALEISGQATHDGGRWFVQDPIAVDLTVTDPDGDALSNASVRVGLIKHSENTVEDTADVTTSADGTASVSLTATEVAIYDIVASASTGSRQGYADIATENAVEQPPIQIPGVAVPSLSSATASSSGTTTLSASVDTDTAQGDLALVAVTTTQPSDDQVLNGQNASGNAAAFAKTVQPSSTGTQSFKPDGLTADTQYDLYWIQDVSGTRSSVAQATATTAQTTSSPSAPTLLAVRRDSTSSPDTTPPTITDVRLTNPQSQDVRVEVDTDEALGQDPSDLSVQLKLDGTNEDVLARSDFTESESSGTYTYAAVYAGSADGTYEGIVQVAKDPAGNDGASGESDTVTVNATAPSAPSLLAVRRDGVDTTPPTISNFSASNPSSQNVQVSFDSSEPLASIELAISGAENATLTEADFTENSGTYTATYAGSVDGDYTATLNQAVDAAGNDGASGQSATVTVTTAPPATVTMDASTTQPSSSVDLTIPHSELATGQTVSLYAGGSDTGQDFTDGSNEYTLSYAPSAPIGSEVDLQARVDDSTDASQLVTITVEEAPDPISDLSLTAGDQQFGATWTVPDTVEGDVQQMEIHVSTSSMADPQPGDSTLAKTVDSGFTEGTSITETVTGQTSGQQLYVQVLTVDADGFFAASNEEAVTPVAPAPSAPTMLAARRNATPSAPIILAARRNA